MDKIKIESEVFKTLTSGIAVSEEFSKFVMEKIHEKHEEQLDYVISPISENIYLEACAGSGKTEVVGMKAAYEINKWNSNGGIAILTFTNEATETIKKRVKQYSNKTSLYPHFIGTLTSFIHGYITQKFGSKFIKAREKDTSYSVIDKNIDIYKNHWLTKYELPISFITKKNTKIKLYAHQLYYDHKIKDFIIHLPNGGEVTLEDYYYSEPFQNFVIDLREKKKQQWLFKLDYIQSKIKKIKLNFYNDGFANFEDLNNIAYTILKNTPVVTSKLAEKYPLILIDECQDLSWIELEILKLLNNSGSILHFIGDLNQAIYEFKNASPEDTLLTVSSFKKMQLTNNFRSCQSIVDVANKVASISIPIKGLAKNCLKEKSVLYLEYNDINTIKETYIKFLKQIKVPAENATILVRQTKLKNLIEQTTDKSQHTLIDSLQLWYTRNPTNQIKALELAGSYIQKYFDGGKSKKDYFCPKGITSTYKWRIFLKTYLESFSNYPLLLDFSNKTYGEWYKEFRNFALKILNEAYQILKEYDNEIELRDFNKMTIRTPSKTAKENIKIIENLKLFEYPSVTTIHSSKGSQYDAVMIVSNENKTSSGNWRKWIENDGEAKRIGYVANTRAKYSLIWAIPTLTIEEKKTIESYGFKSLHSLIPKYRD